MHNTLKPKDVQVLSLLIVRALVGCFVTKAGHKVVKVATVVLKCIMWASLTPVQPNFYIKVFKTIHCVFKTFIVGYPNIFTDLLNYVFTKNLIGGYILFW